MQINTDLVTIQSLHLGSEQGVRIDVLRSDLIHPVISGNKWYKLRFYLEDAISKGYSEIASFGGAYSNHIVATACACQQHQLNSIGFIRGDQTEQLSTTLQSAQFYGMQLQFVSRTDYKNKKGIIENNSSQARYWIPEGGYGYLGAKGAATLLEKVTLKDYTHLIAAIGSGTMVAGLLNASLPHQQVLGISSQKNNDSLEVEVKMLVTSENQERFVYIPDYHFGGFAKHPPELLNFMNQFWIKESVPTDIVYTGKVFYAVSDLLDKSYFKPSDRVLVIHSGGLQGNLSLAKNSLLF
ncbi:MAG: pyridoxal-phosphate dependent enzyme [Bacteroidetes bacterium]|nr:pyridoxal-phosphate dependent enzyme [Bacteroidota bacterium]